MSSVATASVYATRKRSQKVARFGFLGWIPMIQPPFNSSCAALQYETGTKVFYRAVPELHDIQNQKTLVQPHGIFHIFLMFYRASRLVAVKAKERSAHYEASREEASSSSQMDG